MTDPLPVLSPSHVNKQKLASHVCQINLWQNTTLLTRGAGTGMVVSIKSACACLVTERWTFHFVQLLGDDKSLSLYQYRLQTYAPSKIKEILIGTRTRMVCSQNQNLLPNFALPVFAV